MAIVDRAVPVSAAADHPAPPGPGPAGARDRLNPHVTYWLIRAAGFGLVAGITLTRGGHHLAFDITVLTSCGALLIFWGLLDWRDHHRTPWPAWLRVATYGVLGVVGGIGAALSPARSLLAFALVAAIAVGNDLPAGPAAAVTAAAVLGVEGGGLIFGFSTSSAVGFPLVLIVALLAGRNRRSVRIQSAQAAALAARTRQAQAEQRRAAALEERSRIAREIHDVLAHSLSALGVQIETARSVLTDTGDITSAVALLEHAGRLADDGLSETRRAVHALRTDVPPLPASVASLAGNHEQHYQRAVAVSVTGQARPVSPDANVALIRTAREALTNAARHAPGAAVGLNLDYDGEQVTMTISNSVPPAMTAGADAASGQDGSGSGYGLAGMRERLQLIGGTLTAGRSGDEWTVQARVPL